MSGGMQCFRLSAGRPGLCHDVDTCKSGRDKFTGPYPFCPSFRQTRRGPMFPAPRALGTLGVGMSKWQLMTRRLPTLRFRAKIILGFGLVLAILAVSLTIAWLGFEKVSSAVASWRTSVSEADLARNIDRELIAYRSSVKYYVVTGKEDDAKAAGDAESGLRSAIEQAIKGARKPARIEGLNRLAAEFRNFTDTFADILKVKRESALVVQNQLVRNANMLRYKIDDIASNAQEAELQALEFGAKQTNAQLQAAVALANTFVVNWDQTVASSALARLKFVENSLHAINATDDKIVGGLKEAKSQLGEYGAALTKLVENARTIDELVMQMGGSAGAIMQGVSAMKADLVADQQRFEAQSDAMIGETERLIVMLAI